MIDILFEIVFPLVLLGFLIIIFLSSISNKVDKKEIMNLDDFIYDWLRDHGQKSKIDEQFEKMKKDPAGKLYMPMTYKGAKIFMKFGVSPNKVSVINLILSFFIFYGVIMASRGHSLNIISQQPFYGSWFIILAFLVLFTGIIDGIDGAIARLLNIKSKRGAWFDNVIDRISDILMLVGLIPYNLLLIQEQDYNLDFTWIVWTNIFLIFLYEYMRARHEGLGLYETKPFISERITRVLVTMTFFLIYGISSFAVLITYWIDPSSASSLWSSSHLAIITWSMLIFQIILLGMVVFSSIQLGRYSYKQLKIIDEKDQA